MVPVLELLPRPRRRRAVPRWELLLLALLCVALSFEQVFASETRWPWVIADLACAGVLVWSGFVLEPQRRLALAGTLTVLASGAAHVLRLMLLGR